MKIFESVRDHIRTCTSAISIEFVGVFITEKGSLWSRRQRKDKIVGFDISDPGPQTLNVGGNPLPSKGLGKGY